MRLGRSAAPHRNLQGVDRLVYPAAPQMDAADEQMASA